MVSWCTPGKSTNALVPPSTEHILGKFQVDQHYYSIIWCEHSHQTSSEISTLSANLNCTGAEVGRFELNGKLCRIMKVRVDSGVTNQANLLKLLTDRELQIIQLVAQGQANKQIAKYLHISEWTVATHLRRIFAKLGVDSRAAMVCRCAPIVHPDVSVDS